MMDGPGQRGERDREPRMERSEEAVADLELDARDADEVKGGDFNITKQTDSTSPKLS